MQKSTFYTNRRRRMWIESGLTTEGTQRVNQQHPELAGLSGREYHTKYMRKQRESDRRAWQQPTKENLCPTS